MHRIMEYREERWPFIYIINAAFSQKKATDLHLKL